MRMWVIQDRESGRREVFGPTELDRPSRSQEDEIRLRCDPRTDWVVPPHHRLVAGRQERLSEQIAAAGLVASGGWPRARRVLRLSEEEDLHLGQRRRDRRPGASPVITATTTKATEMSSTATANAIGRRASPMADPTETIANTAVTIHPCLVPGESPHPSRRLTNHGGSTSAIRSLPTPDEALRRRASLPCPAEESHSSSPSTACGEARPCLAPLAHRRDI